MKKTSIIAVIICLLLTSCQLKNTTVSQNAATTSATAEAATVFNNAQEQLSNIIGSLAASTSASSTDISQTVEITSGSAAVSVTDSASTSATTRTTVPSTKPTTKPTTKPSTKPATKPSTVPTPSDGEMRAIWISCYDYTSAAGKTRAQYKAVTDTMFKNISDCGFNTAFVHLRAFSDAFYKSSIYPYSSYIAGKEGNSLPFDPFEVLLESADKYNVSVHGWINPFRVSTKSDTSLLSAKNPAKIILNEGNKDGRICVLSNGIYYNPSHLDNHKLILDGVREILNSYDIDGIHIDDYFYPSTDAKIDSAQYKEYKSNGGKMSLSEWRISNVNAFVSSLYSTVKSADSSVIVSISPAAQIDKNKNELYADCKLWLSQKGYADIIIPQIYFGFEHSSLPFPQLLAQWANLPRHSSVKLVCGIAAYKCATEDAYAGAGKTEWKTNTDILARQVKGIRNNRSYSGFAVFSYKDLIRNSCKTEIDNLKKII